MATHTTKSGMTFTDADIINPDDFIAGGEYNPHNVHPILLYGVYGTIGVVFASHLQDALDIAVDENKLNGYAVADEDLADYGDDEDGIARLGNAGEPFNIQDVGAEDLVNPPFSFVALMNAAEVK